MKADSKYRIYFRDFIEDDFSSSKRHAKLTGTAVESAAAQDVRLRCITEKIPYNFP